MGMTDTLRLFGGDAERVRCAAGHPARGQITTKSFACKHDDYYVFERQLYIRRSPADEPEDLLLPALDGDRLTLSRRHLAEKVELSSHVEAHTHCEECDPLIYEHESWDRTDHRHVWCEWNLF